MFHFRVLLLHYISVPGGIAYYKGRSFASLQSTATTLCTRTCMGKHITRVGVLPVNFMSHSGIMQCDTLATVTDKLADKYRQKKGNLRNNMMGSDPGFSSV
jgi:hypothetical protein